MEAKLMNAAALLPNPRLDFQTIEQQLKITAKPQRKTGKALRVALAAVLILCLCTTAFAYGKVKYGLWSGLHSTGYGDVKLLNWKYDYNFPEEFQGLPFNSVSTLYGAPHGASHLEALLKPTYTMHTITYGDYSVTVEGDGTVIDAGLRINIGFGSNQDENWKYHFSVGEDGFCNYEGVIPGSQWKTEYREYELYVCSIGDCHRVHWEDTKRQIIVSLRSNGVKTQEEAVAIAKALIDLNS